MSERFVTAAELAREMGVSLRTVRRWTAEGMPSETWGMRVRRYRPSEAIAWARTAADGTISGNHSSRPAQLMTARVPDTEE
jgi:phage terminase Nu1 subunit (DNA packaging protein)